MELEAKCKEQGDKLAVYEKLEQELDDVIMQAAESKEQQLFILLSLHRNVFFSLFFQLQDPNTNRLFILWVIHFFKILTLRIDNWFIRQRAFIEI